MATFDTPPSACYKEVILPYLLRALGDTDIPILRPSITIVAAVPRRKHNPDATSLTLERN